MASKSCHREILLPDNCECCAEQGLVRRKFQWKLPPLVESRSNKIMKWTERTGYFCREGHFWEKRRRNQLIRLVQKRRRAGYIASEGSEQADPRKGKVDYGVDRQRRKNRQFSP